MVSPILSLGISVLISCLDKSILNWFIPLKLSLCIHQNNINKARRLYTVSLLHTSVTWITNLSDSLVLKVKCLFFFNSHNNWCFSKKSYLLLDQYKIRKSSLDAYFLAKFPLKLPVVDVFVNLGHNKFFSFYWRSGDTAVAVHPEEEKYKHLHGKMLQHPFTDRKIPIIADDFVERGFGTGV